jgi:hypothetical protein
MQSTKPEFVNETGLRMFDWPVSKQINKLNNFATKYAHSNLQITGRDEGYHDLEHDFSTELSRTPGSPQAVRKGSENWANSRFYFLTLYFYKF